MWWQKFEQNIHEHVTELGYMRVATVDYFRLHT